MKALHSGIAILFMLSGCSNRQLYDATQGERENACRQIADAQKRERCLDSARESYPTYERRRSESRNGDDGFDNKAGAEP